MVSLKSIENYSFELYPDATHAAISLDNELKGEKIVLVTSESKMNKSCLQSYVKLQKMSPLLRSC